MGTKAYTSAMSKKGPTPQSRPIRGREKEMVKNSAGGFTFQLGDWDRLDRFLILGSEGNTYYATEQKMTLDNAHCVLRCLEADGLRVVARIVAISEEGRAPKNDPALFALALAAASDKVEVRQWAMAALPRVARIGTHLFHFAEFVNSQRGWGRALKRAIGKWYQDKPIEALIGQVSKYQSRDGWSNRDLLRLAHIKPDTKERSAIYAWACGKDASKHTPAKLKLIDEIMKDHDPEKIVEAIHDMGLVRENLPTEALKDVDVWAALLEKMPMTAMIRNLGNMTEKGLLKPLGGSTGHVVKQLRNEEALQKALIHPFNVLVGMKTYAQGHGFRGGKTWTPVPLITDALQDAFYLSFKGMSPTGKRIMVGLDVSGSMTQPIMNSNVECAEGAAAMAMAVVRTEENYHIMAFDHRIRKLPITKTMSLPEVLKHTRNINGGGTDAALPAIYAKEQNLEVDCFVVITDNETWAGGIQPVEALNAYRKHSGINAKMVVIGMTSTGFTIADPKDPGMLDVVGFDSSAPNIIQDFIRG